MKKALSISLITSIFLLTGCFGSNDTIETPEFAGFSTYNAPGFSISVPASWETIEPKDFTSDIPSQTQIIFRNNIKNDIFTANANVTKSILSSAMTTQEFAKSEISGNKSTLLNYQEISRNNEHKIIVGGEIHNTVMILFEGKENEQQPTLRITQTYAVNGADAYTITSAYLKDSDEILAENAQNIIKTFKVK